jgi:uncharacterized membrane protein
MADDESKAPFSRPESDGRRVPANGERPPRLRLIRVFLAVLAGFMAGLVGWMFVAMAALSSHISNGASSRLLSMPLGVQVIAFLVPALVVGYLLFEALGRSH